MDRVRYRFTGRENDLKSIDDSIHFYYQICVHPHPKTGRYCMRKFVIDGNDKFIAIEQYKLSEKIYKKFFKMKKPHEYKCISAYDLDNTEYPKFQEVRTAKSDILSNSYGYSGFAPVF